VRMCNILAEMRCIIRLFCFGVNTLLHCVRPSCLLWYVTNVMKLCSNLLLDHAVRVDLHAYGSVMN
jgi:hypothetical protein